MPIRLLSVGGNLTLTRSRRSNLPLALAHGQRIDLGAILFASERKAGARPGPAGEAVRHRAGHEIARMRRRGERRQRQRRKAGHDELPILPLRLGPILRARVVRRDAPQFERRRPQAETEDDARRLGGRVGSDMRADRGAGRRADGRHPARILLRGVLRLLVHRVGIARRDEPERVIAIDPRHRTSSATAPRWMATRLASAVPMPLPISTWSQ